ncbi:MAG: single-stranded DNA-binding protein [Actinobacteria bacterium]|nr:single-stranded DNA-binding protein [Actinomycetota bacterium]
MQYARLEISGNAVANPTATFNGTTRVELRIAATPRHQDASGNWKDGHTAFVSVIAFGDLAENIIESVQMGTAVKVTTKARTSEWVDEGTGDKRSRLEFIASEFAIDLTHQKAAVTKTSRTTAGV